MNKTSTKNKKTNTHSSALTKYTKKIVGATSCHFSCHSTPLAKSIKKIVGFTDCHNGCH